MRVVRAAPAELLAGVRVRAQRRLTTRRRQAQPAHRRGARTHTHADSLIHAVHAILCERAEYAEYVAPLVDPLLTTLRNAAPRWRGLGDGRRRETAETLRALLVPSRALPRRAEQARPRRRRPRHRRVCLSHGAGRNPRLVLELCRGDARRRWTGWTRSARVASDRRGPRSIAFRCHD